MPRKRSVDINALKEVLIIHKSNIVKENGNLAVKSDEVWNTIAQELNGHLTPLALYTLVRKNRYDVWRTLQYSYDFECPASNNENNPSDVDSEHSEIDDSIFLKFEAKLPVKDFENMIHEKIYKCSDGTRKAKLRNYMTFKAGWTHTLYDLFFRSTSLPCTMVFKRAKIHPIGHTFATFYATCKDCASVLRGSILDEPDNESDVPISFTLIGNFKQPHLMNYKRPLSTSIRTEAISEMRKQNVSASVYRQIKAQEVMNFGDPEPRNIPSSNVLRVAKHDVVKSGRIHKDPVVALSILKATAPFYGIIKDIGLDRFFVHYWSSSQMHIYNEYCKRNTPSIIAIDATGSVCQKIKRESGKSQNIFLYEITILEKGIGQQFSASNMLSERHDANSISYWLCEWIRSGFTKPDIVVSDMSLALLSAEAKAFTEFSTLNEYLEQCNKLLFRKGTQSLPKTFIRCDVAHFMKLISQWKSLQGQMKRTRQFFLRVMAQAVQADSISLLEKIFSAVFTVAISETEGNNEENEPIPSEKSKIFLKNLIGGHEIEKDNIITQEMIEETEETAILNYYSCIENESNIEDIDLMKLWLREILMKCETNIQNKEGDRGNQQYLPKIVNDIISVGKYIPLWSGVMLPHFKYGEKTASTAAVESSFNNIKNRIFSQEELPLRADDFVRKHIKAIDGNMKLLFNKIKCKDNFQKVFESRQVDHPLKDDCRNVPKCPACSAGDMPTGAHRCIECDVSVHIFPECSEPIQGEEEGYGEKRRCRNCCSGKNVEKEAKAEMEAVENWRGLILPPKKRLRTSYLEHNREWIDIDLSRNGPVSCISVLKNGSNPSLKPVTLMKEKFISTNTCAFDTITAVLCTAYIDSSKFKFLITEEDAAIIQLAKNIALHGVKSCTYKKRVEILKSLFPTEQLISNIKRLNVECAVSEMLKKVLSTAESQKITSSCNETDCPAKIRVIKDASIPVNISCSADVHQLQSKIEEQMLLQNHSFCKLPKNINTTHDVCRGQRLSSIEICNLHIFLEIVSTSEEFTEDVRILLSDVPQKLKLSETDYILRGLISYIGSEIYSPNETGHYVSFCRRHNGDWELYDDLKERCEKKSPKTQVRPHLIYYSV